MDYAQSSLTFRIKKAMRYARLYGPRRTYYKIMTQQHARRTYSHFPPCPQPAPQGGHVGIIGCGKFAFGTIGYYLRKNFGDVIRGCMDIDKNRAYSLFKFFNARYFTTDASDIITDSDIDLVYIVSNHASHTDYAIEALAAGKHVHIEKPHVVSAEQLERLCNAVRIAKTKVNLGFNRPYSPMTEQMARVLDAQAGPGMMNWFIVGHALNPDHWYFDPAEGGHVLGNLCHWTDFVYRLLRDEDRFPIMITPVRWRTPDYHLSVSLLFGDGSIAVLTFSSKGDTFEGVRERFSGQKGDAIVYLDDFERLRIDVGSNTRVWSPLFRDHGHEATVRASYAMTGRGPNVFAGCSHDYLMGTGKLFLATKDALERNDVITLPALWEPDPSGGRFGASSKGNEIHSMPF